MLGMLKSSATSAEKADEQGCEGMGAFWAWAAGTAQGFRIPIRELGRATGNPARIRDNAFPVQQGPSALREDCFHPLHPC